MNVPYISKKEIITKKSPKAIKTKILKIPQG